MSRYKELGNELETLTLTFEKSKDPAIKKQIDQKRYILLCLYRGV